MPDQSETAPPPSGQALNIGLWIAQGLIFVLFIMFGALKLFMPIAKLAAMWHWPGELPVWFVRLMGVIDAAGGIGVFIPAVTRIRPGLTVPAAYGCTALQVCAIVFHISRGEAAVTPFNFVLLALCIFIVWGRTRIQLGAKLAK